ncbi:DNA-directed RNA polymerase subunit omega [Anaerotignum sp.]|uniref:DNA-directed RNA polymerase subunit omega n=1 Tax=Anaerotignum sp. TaxID=2039241 RepID=UPI00331B2331
MLRPSYTDLLEVINQETDDITLGSRYTIVIAAAKRARQLVDHAEPLVNKIKVDKPVSIAVNELYEGKIKVRQAKDWAYKQDMLLIEEKFETTGE